jgi:hypothetical protein
MSMTVSEMVDLICDELGKTDSATRSVAKRMLQRDYKLLWDRDLWVDTLQIYQTTSSLSSIILPNHLSRPVAVALRDSPASPIDPANIISINPASWGTLGKPSNYHEFEPVGVNVLPTSATVLKIVSDSTTDTGIDVLIRGFNGDVEQRETITLNGTTTVTGTLSWTTPTLISKAETTGTVTIKDASGTTLQTLWAEEHNRLQSRLIPFPVPDASINVLVLAKKKLREMTDDNDAPALRDCENALIAFTTGRLLRRARQFSKADRLDSIAMSHLENLPKIERQQAASITQIEPVSMGEVTINDFESGLSPITKQNA